MTKFQCYEIAKRHEQRAHQYAVMGNRYSSDIAKHQAQAYRNHADPMPTKKARTHG